VIAVSLVWSNRTVAGQVCPPDYVLLQSEQINAGWNVLGLNEHPTKNVIVAHSLAGPHVTAISFSGTGRSMTFDMSATVDDGIDHLVPGGKQSRPGVFDSL
jgi:hypothetical protein